MSSVVVVECKTLSGCAHVYQHSASYDLWAGDTKTVKTQDRELIRLDPLPYPRGVMAELLRDMGGQNVVLLFSME